MYQELMHFRHTFWLYVKFLSLLWSVVVQTKAKNLVVPLWENIVQTEKKKANYGKNAINYVFHSDKKITKFSIASLIIHIAVLVFVTLSVS